MSPRRFEWKFISIHFKLNLGIDGWGIWWNCPQKTNVTEDYWWWVNIGWGNDLVLLGNKPLCWANVGPDSCHHMVSHGHSVLMVVRKHKWYITWFMQPFHVVQSAWWLLITWYLYGARASATVMMVSNGHVIWLMQPFHQSIQHGGCWSSGTYMVPGHQPSPWWYSMVMF